jgi:predicted DNA-binding protein with PD1-like motif
MLVMFVLHKNSKKMNLQLKNIAFAISAILLFASCKKNETMSAPTVVKEYSIKMSAANEISANNRMETSVAALKILSDNSITLTTTLSNFSYGDTIKAAHIHVGNAVNNGSVILPFTIVATGASLEAKALDVRQTLIDSLKNNVTEFYANIHTIQMPGGLLRGQIGKNILQAYNVALSGTNQPNPVTTTATGIAIVRIIEDNRLFSKITINNLETTDTLRYAHIHIGAAGSNGPVIVNLADTKDDFGTTQIRMISAGLADSIATKMIYINVHSNFSPGGKIRGQIR